MYVPNLPTQEDCQVYTGVDSYASIIAGYHVHYGKRVREKTHKNQRQGLRFLKFFFCFPPLRFFHTHKGEL